MKNLMKKDSKGTEVGIKRTEEGKPWNVEAMFDRLFDDPWFRAFPRPWMENFHLRPVRLEPPVLDMFEDKADLVIKAEIPGLAREDIDIRVDENLLTIRGEKKKEEEVRHKDYYRSERSYGAFSRSMQLPVGVRTEDVKASFKNGVLEIRMPKKTDAKRNVVQVKVA